MIRGQCHCGNIQLSIPKLTETATGCNCSICHRYAAIWGFYTESEVVVTVGEDGMSSYSYGDRQISFNRCSRCGCITHYTSTTPTEHTRLAVNYRMFPAGVVEQVKVRKFDGADSWRYLD